MGFSSQVDPKLTEVFLLHIPAVVQASVWMRNGVMSAHVVVHDDSGITARSLKASIAEELGLHQTPYEITVSQARLRAA